MSDDDWEDWQARRGRILNFGVTYASRFPPYVFSTSGNGLLVHRVEHLQLQWYAWSEELGLTWQTLPAAIAKCICGQTFLVSSGGRARFCQQPHPEAVLCGRCQGQPPPFGHQSAFSQLPTRKEKRRARREAHAHLVGRPFRRGRPRKA
jgi:hypothetical protein